MTEPQTEMDPLMHTKEVLRLLNVCRRTLSRLKKRKEHPFPKSHGALVGRYRRAEVYAWVDEKNR